MSVTTKLRAGAAEAPILFPDAMFPTGGEENYTGVHDAPYVHVICLEHSGVRYAIVGVDIVTIPQPDAMKQLTAETLGAAPENVIMTNAHVLTTPHNFHRARSGAEKAIEDMMDAAIMDALRTSLNGAKASLRPALFGYRNGFTNFNVNRVLDTGRGWIQGTCDEGDSDHSLPVFRFDDLDGNTIAIFYIVNCAAGMLENTRSDDGGRLVSNDIAGASQRFVRREFGEGCTVMYLAGATGDQWQAMRGLFGTVGRGGVYRERDLGDRGWILLELMGDRLGQQIVRAADSIQCGCVDRITLTKAVVSLPGRVVPSAGFQPGAPLRRGPEKDVVVSLMTFDDLLWIGVTPEMQVSTVRAVKEASPFAETAFSGWTNEGSDSTGSYLPEDVLYRRRTYQSFKSHFYPGAAAVMRDALIRLSLEAWERSSGIK